MDEEILQIADKDKEKGFRCLIERYQEPLYWHVRRMLPGHDDAEDVLHVTAKGLALETCLSAVAEHRTLHIEFRESRR